MNVQVIFYRAKRHNLQRKGVSRSILVAPINAVPGHIRFDGYTDQLSTGSYSVTPINSVLGHIRLHRSTQSWVIFGYTDQLSTGSYSVTPINSVLGHIRKEN